MEMTATRALLSAEELRSYHEKGFVIPKFRLDEATAKWLDKTVHKIVNDSPDYRDMVIPNPHCASSHRIGVHTDGSLMKLIANPDLLDMVEQIIGPDIICWTAAIFHKPAVRGDRTPPHRDGELYKTIDPMVFTSIWVAVTESSPENGCVRFFPGSHLWEEGRKYELIENKNVPFEIDMSGIDEDQAVDIVLEPGQMVFFHHRMIHSANANRGQRPRTGLAMRYMPGTSRFFHDRTGAGAGQFNTSAFKPMFLLRGEDRAGNDFERNVYPEDLKWIPARR